MNAASFANDDDVPEVIGGTGAYLADNDAATEDGTTTLAAALPASGAVELVLAFQIDSAEVTDDDTIDFRIVEADDTPLDTYTQTFTATVTGAAGGAASGSGSGTTPAITASGTAEAEAAAAGAIDSTGRDGIRRCRHRGGRRRGWDGPSGHGSRLGWCRGGCGRVWHNRIGNSGRSRRSGSRRCW